MKRVRWKNRRPTLDREARRYYVYRLWDAEGTLLYIGRTCDPDMRLRAHRCTNDWAAAVATMTVDPGGPMAWDEACAAERAAITDAQPLHNREFVTHNPQQ